MAVALGEVARVGLAVTGRNVSGTLKAHKGFPDGISATAPDLIHPALPTCVHA